MVGRCSAAGAAHHFHQVITFFAGLMMLRERVIVGCPGFSFLTVFRWGKVFGRLLVRS